MSSCDSESESFFHRGQEASFPRLTYSLKQHSSTKIINGSRSSDIPAVSRISEATNRVGESFRALVSQLTPSDEEETNEFSGDGTKFPSSGELSTNSTPKSPLAYRYYARNPKLSHSYGSMPFLLLGPNIDHWKVVARELASRGYNVIVCERVGLEEMQKKKSPWTQHDSTVLIKELLDALRWNMVIMIACDEEAIVAVEAAMNLAPERISALILCGRIPNPEGFWKEYSPLPLKRELGEYDSVDELLQDNLRCPFSIVWDGAIPPPPELESRDSFSQSFFPTRNLILGGGSAPHRRRPELFAWSMTRFVEENLITRTKRPDGDSKPKRDDLGITEKKELSPFLSQMNELFNPESFVVGGRLIATAILYVALLRTLFFQYGQVRWATINVGSAVKMVFTFPITMVRAFTLFLTKLKNSRSTFIHACCAAFSYCRAILFRQTRQNDIHNSDNSIEKTDDQNGPESDLDSETPSRHEKKDDDEDEPDGESDSEDPSQKPKDSSDENRRKQIPRPYFYLDNVIV